MHRLIATLFLLAVSLGFVTAGSGIAAEPLLIGVAETDITPASWASATPSPFAPANKPVAIIATEHTAAIPNITVSARRVIAYRSSSGRFGT